MIGDLKPYLAYKDSGVPWLGKLPDHWAVLPNRALFAEVVERNRAGEQMLAVTISRGVIRQRALLADKSRKDGSNEDRSAYKLVRVGDIAYNKMRAWQGAIGVSEYRGIVSPAYVVLRLRGDQNPRYFHYLLRTPAFAIEAERWSYGITSDQWSLRPEHFKMIYCCLPPLPEQSAMRRFLDHAERRIGLHIGTRQKLMAVLDEQKQAFIHRTMTRGLDPCVRFRESGVEWLGDVPEHWRISRLHEITDARRPIMYGIVLPGPSVDEGVYIVKGGNCEPGRLRPELLSRTTFEIEARHARSRLRQGDIVFAIRGGVGAAELVPAELEGANLTQDAARIAAGRGVSPHWLLYAVRAPVFREHVNARIVGATVHGVNIRDLKRVQVAVPPPEEQSAIASFLGGVSAYVDAALTQTRREIGLLREYGTRLVADVVTGKLDVREAVAALPEEPEETEPPEDVDALPEEYVDESEAVDPDEALEEADA